MWATVTITFGATNTPLPEANCFDPLLSKLVYVIATPLVSLLWTSASTISAPPLTTAAWACLFTIWLLSVSPYTNTPQKLIQPIRPYFLVFLKKP